MKLYGVILHDYFGKVFKTVYFSSKEEAERLADSWEHFTEIKGKTVEDVEDKLEQDNKLIASHHPTGNTNLYQPCK